MVSSVFLLSPLLRPTGVDHRRFGVCRFPGNGFLFFFFHGFPSFLEVFFAAGGRTMHPIERRGGGMAEISCEN